MLTGVHLGGEEGVNFGSQVGVVWNWNRELHKERESSVGGGGGVLALE